MMALSGVRSSWLMLATNALFARLASSAVSTSALADSTAPTSSLNEEVRPSSSTLAPVGGMGLAKSLEAMRAETSAHIRSIGRVSVLAIQELAPAASSSAPDRQHSERAPRVEHRAPRRRVDRAERIERDAVDVEAARVGIVVAGQRHDPADVETALLSERPRAHPAGSVEATTVWPSTSAVAVCARLASRSAYASSRRVPM